MESNMREKNRQAMKTFAALQKKNPNAMKGFLDFVNGVNGEGGLSPKIKQIISVAISIIQQCEWCIAYHTKKALDLGATEKEIMDACFVASFFGGGPAMMHSKLVMDAIEEFSNGEKTKIT